MNRLRKTLSETNKIWESFNAENGDLAYFVDSEFSETNSYKDSLYEINKSFQRLKTLQQCLDDLSACCKDSANAVSQELLLL